MTDEISNAVGDGPLLHQGRSYAMLWTAYKGKCLLHDMSPRMSCIRDLWNPARILLLQDSLAIAEQNIIMPVTHWVVRGERLRIEYYILKQDGLLTVQVESLPPWEYRTVLIPSCYHVDKDAVLRLRKLKLLLG